MPRTIVRPPLTRHDKLKRPNHIYISQLEPSETSITSPLRHGAPSRIAMRIHPCMVMVNTMMTTSMRISGRNPRDGLKSYPKQSRGAGIRGGEMSLALPCGIDPKTLL